MVDGSVIQKVGGNNLLDDLGDNLLAEVLGGDLLSVLGGDDDGIDTEGDGSTTLLLVLDSDLSLRVRSEPAKLTAATGIGHRLVELVGQHDGEGHVFLSLIRGIPKHDTLITSTVVLEVTMVQALSNVGGLLLDGNEDVAGFVVETLGRVVVADLLDGFTDDLLVVELGLGGDFTEHHDHTGLGGGLAGNLGPGILGQAGIELKSLSIFTKTLSTLATLTIASETWSQILSGGGDETMIVARRGVDQLTRMTLTNRLGGEQKVAWGQSRGGSASGGHFYEEG